MTSLDPLERVVSVLARDPNLPRVKKLLYCACYGVWEDNVQRLNQVSLQEIVQGVWERSPTLEALQFQLNRVVKTLNKPVAYAHVANGTLQVLNELYLDTYDITQPVMGNRVQLPTSSPVVPSSEANYPSGNYSAAPAAPPVGQGLGRYEPQPHYQAPAAQEPPVGAVGESPATQWFIAGQSDDAGLTPAQLSAQTAVRAHVLQSLVQHQEQQRIKKLLVCVCYNQWENDRAQLAALDWEHLLDETRQLMPTLQGLDHVLQAIVNSLSKPMEYLRVAKLLVEIVTPLYEQERPDETQFFGVVPEPMTAVRPASGPSLGSSNPASGYGPGGQRGQAGSPHTAPMNFSASAASAPPSPASPPLGHAGSHGLGLPGAGVYGQSHSRRSSDEMAGSTPTDIAEGSDGPPTGLFATQLPASPMDSKYPPRALPANAGGDDTAVVTEVVQGNPYGGSYQLPQNQGHPIAQPVGAGAYKDARDGAPAMGDFVPGRDLMATSTEEEAENADFALRLNLMRYANPLMAKVVMFSALHHLFRFSEQDWAELRHHSLASLVAQLEERYPNLTDLEMKLCGVAEQLEVPEQAMQTVAALIKSLKPRYERAVQSPARDFGLTIAAQASTPDGELPQVERATAIQFGPEDGGAAIVAGERANVEFPEAPAQPVTAEVIPDDDASCEALMSDDLEADLALLAASLEDDGPSLPFES